MSTTAQADARTADASAGVMRAAVFERPGRIALHERPIPPCGPNDAIVRVALTTICGTDVHILRGEYPVAPGRIVGHEPVGVIHELGSAVSGYEVGDRVLVAAMRRARSPSCRSTSCC
jgi:threonine dehydrogenase-like Zn-dependent dehydrogenase